MEEMPDQSWRDRGDPALHDAIRSLWSFSAKAFPHHFPAGVYKHRTAEEGHALQVEWEKADFETLWRRRGGRPTGRAK